MLYLREWIQKSTKLSEKPVRVGLIGATDATRFDDMCRRDCTVRCGGQLPPAINCGASNVKQHKPSVIVVS